MGARAASNAFAETLAACRAAAHNGELETALALAQRAAAERPQSFDALFLTAIALQRLGRLRESTVFYRRAIAVNGNVPEALHNLGCALLELREIGEALPVLERAHALRPNDAPTLDALGFAAAESGDSARALTLFERSLQLDDRQVPVHGRMGNLLLRMQRYHEAVQHFAIALDRAPDSADLFDGLGVALDHLGQIDEAAVVLRRALELDPANANAACNLGKVLLTAGDVDEAMRWFDRAIELEPRNGGFYLPLVTGGSKSIKPEHVEAMIALGNDIETLPKLQQIDLHFALGNVYERQGRVDEAFHHLLAGNTLKRADIPYNERAATAYVRATEAAFSSPVMERLRGCGDPSTRPIFIVGMPRSGSTLVEQLFAAHPAVTGAGEIGTIGSLMRDAWPEIEASTLDDLRAQVRAIGEAYLRATNVFGQQTAFVADKTLENFQLLPLIHCALPNARIIHIQRDALDTCFSCFATFFAETKIPFSYDLRELGRYYRGYVSMMDRWRAFVPPDRLIEVQYEDLVANFEDEARRILAFCNLEWDPACLRFYEARRPVRTASNLQVRQPLYAHSVGRAQPFLAHLGPLIETITAPRAD